MRELKPCASSVQFLSPHPTVIKSNFSLPTNPHLHKNSNPKEFQKEFPEEFQKKISKEFQKEFRKNPKMIP